MALYQELTGQGRVVGGHLVGGVVRTGGATGFARKGDLSIQHASNPFKRPKINADTVTEWHELDAPDGLSGVMAYAAARASLPGMAGKAVGAGLNAAFSAGHTILLSWSDGKQSVIELPEKQFMLLSVLLKDRQVVVEPPEEAEPPSTSARSATVATLTSALLRKGRGNSPSEESGDASEITEQITKLAALHAQGILTDREFEDKKADLLSRL